MEGVFQHLLGMPNSFVQMLMLCTAGRSDRGLTHYLSLLRCCTQNCSPNAVRRLLYSGHQCDACLLPCTLFFRAAHFRCANILFWSLMYAMWMSRNGGSFQCTFNVHLLHLVCDDVAHRDLVFLWQHFDGCKSHDFCWLARAQAQRGPVGAARSGAHRCQGSGGEARRIRPSLWAVQILNFGLSNQRLLWFYGDYGFG